MLETNPTSQALSHDYKTRFAKNAKPTEPPCLNPSKPDPKWVPWQGDENLPKGGMIPKSKSDSPTTLLTWVTTPRVKLT